MFRGVKIQEGRHMELRSVFKDKAKNRSLAWRVIEQDYILSWILYGIAHTEELQSTLAFKGGTALKKIYFGDYRFSQDLDFTALDGAPKGDALEKAVRKACAVAADALADRIPDPAITCERYKEKNAHPQEQEAFVIRAQLPWQGYPYVRVLIEVTRNQTVIIPPVAKRVIHDYRPEELYANILTFTLDEIFAEKLLAMYENTIKVHEKAWCRSRVRDYYDLWRLLGTYKHELNEKTIREVLQLKCSLSGSSFIFTSSDDFFDDVLLDKVKIDWNEWLREIVWPLPPYEEVVPELQDQLKTFFSWPNTRL